MRYRLRTLLILLALLPPVLVFFGALAIWAFAEVKMYVPEKDDAAVQIQRNVEEADRFNAEMEAKYGKGWRVGDLD